jgi:hypothetical protein
MRSRSLVSFCLPFLALAPLASAQVAWDEGVNGDLSNDPLMPSSVALAVGTSSLFATTGGNDREDFLTITVPDGAQLAQLNLVAYASDDTTAFLGLQAGSTITVDIANPNPADLLGWSHFGTGPNNVGTDILDDVGAGAGAIGFTPPLPSGTYTLWLQQGGLPTTYQFDFVVVPTPGSLALLGVAGLVGVRRRR